MLSAYLPSLPRPDPTLTEKIFAVITTLLLSLNVGLLMHRRKHGSCPIGVRRATGAASTLGILSLLCPVCLALPLSLLGLSTALAFLAPFIPLLQILTIMLLLGALWLLMRG